MRIRNSTALLGRSPALVKRVNISPGGDGPTRPEALSVLVGEATMWQLLSPCHKRGTSARVLDPRAAACLAQVD